MTISAFTAQGNKSGQSLPPNGSIQPPAGVTPSRRADEGRRLQANGIFDCGDGIVFGHAGATSHALRIRKAGASWPRRAIAGEPGGGHNGPQQARGGGAVCMRIGFIGTAATN